MAANISLRAMNFIYSFTWAHEDSMVPKRNQKDTSSVLTRRLWSIMYVVIIRGELKYSLGWSYRLWLILTNMPNKAIEKYPITAKQSIDLYMVMYN